LKFSIPLRNEVNPMNLYHDGRCYKQAAYLLAGACLSVALLLGCGEKKAASPVAPTVEVANVVQKDVPIVQEWVGSTDGLVNAKINAQVQGYLIKQN
jgi:hypothetical protein